MKIRMYICILFYVVTWPLEGALRHNTSAFPYFFFLTDLISQDELLYRSGSITKKPTSYGDRFLTLFQDSLHDGFFGGVKWGVAACFYQVLYELSGGVVSLVPTVVCFFKQLCTRAFNALCGKPDAFSVRELSIIAQFFHDNMHDFYKKNITGLSSEHDVETIKQVCMHSIEYLKIHRAYYINTGKWTLIAQVAQVTSSYNAQEISFIIIFLIQHLTRIIELLQEVPLRIEYIMQNTKTIVQTFHTLSLLLEQKTNAGQETSGVFGAWFSNEHRKNV